MGRFEGLRSLIARYAPVEDTPERRAFFADRRARQPGFVDAVRADALEASRRRAERPNRHGRLDEIIQILRLMLITDAFFGLVCYRAKVALQVKRVPLLPRILHHLAIAHGQVCIGDPVIIGPGVYFPHGQVVIDGITELHGHNMVAPFTTIGLIAGSFSGPVIEEGVRIGTGARVLGDLTIGRHAFVGANAVVVRDVAPNESAVGVPAHAKKR